MARDETGREHDSDRSALKHRAKQSKLLDRREYVKLAGASVAALGGIGLGSSSALAAESGPSNTDKWNLAFEDKFESGSLDTSKWEVGFGWGMDTTASAESISEKHVNVENNSLHLTASHDSGGGVTAGSVHTRGKHYWGPGSYWEAKIKLPQRVGFLPAFWSKSNDGSWPPEIDFMELFQDGDSDDVNYANYNVHYSESTQPGDSGSHATEPVHHKTEYNLSESAHVFGCKWLTDRVEYFFDGKKVGESNGSTAMEALKNGAPFYMMLNIHIDKIGTTDKSEEWNEEMVVDWVRVWEQSSGDNGSSQDGKGSQDSETTDNEGDSSGNRDSPSDSDGENLPNKLVIDGSDTPNAASTYTFTVSGEVQKSSELGSVNSHDTVEDGEISGRVIGGTDGYRFSGEVTAFTLDGPANVSVEDGS